MPRKPRPEIPDIPIGSAMPHGKFEKYFGIPDWLFMDRSVGWGAKMVYAVVNRFSETYTFPVGGMEFIQQIMGISRGELFKRLNELEDAGFIARELDKKYRRRVRIVPIHNVVAKRFFEEDDGAFEHWEKFRKTNCLQTATLQNYELSPNGDITKTVLSLLGDNTNVVESPNGDITGGSSLLYREILKREPLRREQDQDLLPPFPEEDQNLPQPEDTSQAPEILKQEPPRFASQSTSYDLQLDETDVLVFVKNAYRQSRGAKTSNAELKRYADRIQSAESSMSAPEFRTQLWNYLNTVSEWLRSNKWPIAAFLKEPFRYTPPVPAYQQRQNEPEHLPAPVTSSEAPEIVSEQSEQNTLTYVDRWDSIIPERPVGRLLVSTERLMQAASCKPDFADNFDEICRVCKKLIEAGEPTKFSWLFLVPGSGVPNWDGLLQGKFDFLIKTQKLSAVDEMLARVEREERESAKATDEE